MDPQQFEHVVAAAAEVTDQNELVVIGSQAIFGSFEQPPQSMLHSLEVDISRSPSRATTTPSTSATPTSSHCSSWRRRSSS